MAWDLSWLDKVSAGLRLTALAHDWQVPNVVPIAELMAALRPQGACLSVPRIVLPEPPNVGTAIRPKNVGVTSCANACSDFIDR